MMMKNLTAAIFLSACVAGPALSENIKASNPDGMMAFLNDEGIAASLGVDDYGDPNIEIRYYGTNFSIYFYECTNGARCQAIQFYSGYRTEGSWPQHRANQWNTERRYTRAYITDEGSSRLEFDIFLGRDGMSARDFSDVFSTWTSSLSDFETEIDW